MIGRAVVLLVDDEPHVRDGLQDILHRRRRDWQVLQAEGVDAAEAVLAAHAVDAVITDISMPGRDGLDLLASVRAAAGTRDIPVVVLTGSTSRELKRRCLELGATDFLGKPADPDELTARMDNMLRLKSYQDAIKRQNRELERKVEKRTAQLRDANLELIWRLARAAETRDTDTGFHVLRVGLYSRTLGEALGLAAGTLNLLQHAALLHDVGKIGIPDRILNKPGRLTDEERLVIQGHCRLGHAMLTTDNPMRAAGGPPARGDAAANPFLAMAGAIALAHHELWNGRGYPQGLAGEAIPLEARIVAAADVFDALTSDRVYREAMTPQDGLEHVLARAGEHFDPAVCAALAAVRGAILAIHARYADAPARV